MEKHALYRDNLTIRDHFAGRALQAILSAACKDEGPTAIATAAKRKGFAITAYELADAMLEERDRK